MTRQDNTESLPLDKRILYGLTNWVLFMAGLANLAVGTRAAVNETAAIAATSLTAGLILLFAATIDRFESLKGLGIEAKTKQLDQKIVQADDALRRLREMTELTGSALIDLNSKIGRFNSAPGPRESIALAERVRQIMISLGSEPSTIASTLRPWAKSLCFDVAEAQTKDLNDLILERTKALDLKRQQIPQPVAPDNPAWVLVNSQIVTLSEFQTSRLRTLHLLGLEDYPDKFMNLFKDVPEIESTAVDSLRSRAAQFVPGMHSLRQTQTLADSELWIAEIERDYDS